MSVITHHQQPRGFVGADSVWYSQIRAFLRHIPQPHYSSPALEFKYHHSILCSRQSFCSSDKLCKCSRGECCLNGSQCFPYFCFYYQAINSQCRHDCYRKWSKCVFLLRVFACSSCKSYPKGIILKSKHDGQCRGRSQQAASINPSWHWAEQKISLGFQGCFSIHLFLSLLFWLTVFFWVLLKYFPFGTINKRQLNALRWITSAPIQFCHRRTLLHVERVQESAQRSLVEHLRSFAY